ncbi:MAG: FGGY family carbohydrate kinase [Clostridia bacterium]|jgi:xylulokinase|nr:FGGY family carbohydrate kinase [Clostridia bacterium]MCI1999281.1 FGGY family carbohydrate kinase [Clostridia bacterium]MCI2014766.1 FGGY family carbohydrate kinase [Clostridia bacterium]
MEKYYLGFDAGTQSVKAAVYDMNMNCIAENSNPTTLKYPYPGWVDMDADDYLRAAVKSIKNCVKQMKRKKLDVHGIRALFGDGVILGIVGVDENCNAVTPYINYLDSRTKEDAKYFEEMNLDIWAKETGNPVPSCMFPALFARWFLRNSKKFQQTGKKFMHNAPYILSHLAGLKADDAFIDWGTLSGWGLGYDVIKKTWSDEQLKILELDKKYMPKIVKPWDIIGKVTKEYAEKTGLPEGIPVCAGTGDTMQSMIGCGVTDVNKAADVAGTCAMFCIAVDGIKPELSKPGTDLIFNSGTLENTYFYWGFIRTGGLALRWYRDNVCGQEGSDDYFDMLNEAARSVEPGSNGVIFLPYLTGGVGDISNASGCFLNLTMDTNQAVMWRAVLEAIGYDYIGVTDIYKKAGVELNIITVTEGGSRSNIWNQIKADMMNSTVVTLKTAQGAVMTDAAAAAYAVGDIDNLKAVFENNLIIKDVYKPKLKNTEYYRKIYELKSKLVNTDMKSAFDTLNKIREIQR